jgi:hypothetical protein
MSDPANDNIGKLDRPCANCGKPQVKGYEPFCSPRCKDVDLARWLSGSYAIPVQDDDDDEDGIGQSSGSSSGPGLNDN